MKKNIIIVLSVVLVVGIVLVLTLHAGKNSVSEIYKKQDTIIKTIDRDGFTEEAIHIDKNAECVITGRMSEIPDEQGLISNRSFIMVLDSSLNIKWAKSTPFYDIWAIPLKDNGFALLNQDEDSLYLTKFDDDGIVLWSKKYAQIPFHLNASFATKNVIIETQDRGFAILGDGIIKLDSSGNVEWAKEYSGQGTYWPLSMTGSAITETEDGGYASALWIMDPPREGGSGAVWGCCNDFLVIKTDSKGNLISSRWIGRNLTNEGPNSLIVDEKGNFVVSGWGVTIQPRVVAYSNTKLKKVVSGWGVTIQPPGGTDYTTSFPIVILDKNLNVMSLKDLIVQEGDCYYLSKTPDGYIGAGGGIVELDNNLNVNWAKRNKDIALSYVDTDGYTFVAVGNSPSFLSSNGNRSQILIMKGDVRTFKSDKFKNFEIKEDQFTPDINKLVNLHTEDITSKISVTPTKIKLESVYLE